MSSEHVLEIGFPVMRYDITLPLLEGRVPIDGVKLQKLAKEVVAASPDVVQKMQKLLGTGE